MALGLSVHNVGADRFAAHTVQVVMLHLGLFCNDNYWVGTCSEKQRQSTYLVRAAGGNEDTFIGLLLKVPWLDAILLLQLCQVLGAQIELLQSQDPL